MFYPFRIEKAIQAASVLLSCESHEWMDYLRLLKLLYIADRESVQETGQPIIGSKLVAMRNGPLHSRIYDLVKGEDVGECEWGRYFRTVGYEIQEIRHPGVAVLSRYEVRKLKEVHDRYKSVDTWALVDETHTFEEWKSNAPEGNTSREVPFEDLVKAVGRANDLPDIENEIREAREMERLFG